MPRVPAVFLAYDGGEIFPVLFASVRGPRTTSYSKELLAISLDGQSLRSLVRCLIDGTLSEAQIVLQQEQPLPVTRKSSFPFGLII